MTSCSETLRNLLLLFFSFQAFCARSLAQNLTLTFSPSDAGTCSSATNASLVGGLTFTTSSMPCAAICINLADVFHGNSTGIFNHTRGVTCYDNETSNVTYSISNQQPFDPTANYSRVFYRQTLAAGPFRSNQDMVDDLAYRLVSFWSGADCDPEINEDGEVGERVEPYYAQDCISGPEGQCNTAAVGIKSFLISNTVDTYGNPKVETCRSFAYEGNGARSELWKAGVGFGSIVALVAATL